MSAGVGAGPLAHRRPGRGRRRACAASTVLARAEMGLFLPFMVLPILLRVPGLDVRPAARPARASPAALAARGRRAVDAVEPRPASTSRCSISTNDGTTLLGANCPRAYDAGLIGSWSLQVRARPRRREGLGDPSVEAKEQRRAGLRLHRATTSAGSRRWSSPARAARSASGGPTRWSTPTRARAGRSGRRGPGSGTFWVLTPVAIAGAVVLRRRRVTLAPFAAALATVVLVSGALLRHPPVPPAPRRRGHGAGRGGARRAAQAAGATAPTADAAAASPPTT